MLEFKLKNRMTFIWMLGLSSLLTLLISPTLGQQSIDLQTSRWIAVTEVAGEVYYFNTKSVHTAEVGDRLSEAGDGIRTGSNASALLAVDIGIGTIEIHENTDLEVTSLTVTPNDGRITHLYVSHGGVTLNLRKFTNPESELEIETPTGISGVRGTEFGVNVQLDGTTGTATRTGEVYVEAQAVEVNVVDGYQTLVRPGEPPIPPVPIPEEPEFTYQIGYEYEYGIRRVFLRGKSDLVNRVFVNEQEQLLDAEGRFSYEAPAIRGVGVVVTIQTPLGEETEYDIPLL